MSDSLVSVICLCHNQAKYIEESLQAVFDQTYENIELIVVDDASTDGSKDVINNLLTQHPTIPFIDLSENIGNCKAFNKGLAMSSGEFVVDLAADDVFTPTRIERQIALFDQLDETYGIVHTNAAFVNEQNVELRDHTSYLKGKGLIETMPQGFVYKNVLTRYFISAPTMLVKRAVFDELKGYDEQLSYEDFDFWVRSSRNWKYAYLDEKLTQIRRVKGSLSSKVYQKDDKQLLSTYCVCEKALTLNKSEEENNALASRIKYEIRQAVFSENVEEARLFFRLLKELGQNSAVDNLLIRLSKLNLPLAGLRKFYHKIRYQ